MGNLGIFYDHSVYFSAIGNILWPFGIFYGHLVYFSPIWYSVPRKIWQPLPQTVRRTRTIKRFRDSGGKIYTGKRILNLSGENAFY
jgi:hypothetical protein